MTPASGHMSSQTSGPSEATLSRSESALLLSALAALGASLMSFVLF